MTVSPMIVGVLPRGLPAAPMGAAIASVRSARPVEPARTQRGIGFAGSDETGVRACAKRGAACVAMG